MPTATLLIEIVIIGLFTNLNLLLLFFLFVPFGVRPDELWSAIAQEGAATLVSFILALFSYVLGVLVNVSVSNLFDPIDDRLRERIFDEQKHNELRKIDAWIGQGNRTTRDIYHYMRYRLYAHGEPMKEQLDQHRSEIRILRATALNSYWLMALLLCWPLSQAARWLYGAFLLLLFIFMALLVALNLPLPNRVKQWVDDWKNNRREGFYKFHVRVYWAAILLPWLVALVVWVTWDLLWLGSSSAATCFSSCRSTASWETCGLVWVASSVAAAVTAVASFVLWMKQQERFYHALFQGFRALAVHR